MPDDLRALAGIACLGQSSFAYLWYSSYISYAANDNSEIEIIIIQQHFVEYK